MATTREQIVRYDEEIASLMTRKRVIKEGPGHSDVKRKQVKLVKEQMKAPRNMAQTLRGALEIQRQEVQTLPISGNVDAAAESDGSSSGYRSS